MKVTKNQSNGGSRVVKDVFLPDLQWEQSVESRLCSQHFQDWHHGKVWQPDLQKRRKDTKSDKLCLTSQHTYNVHVLPHAIHIHRSTVDQTYNIHHRQDVVLNVFAPVVTDHHFISHHKRLHKALGADGAFLSVDGVRPFTLVTGSGGGRVDRWRCTVLARCTAFNEVCKQQRDRDWLWWIMK